VEGPALRLYTEEFFNRLRGRLKPGGILALQAMEISTVEFEDHRTVRRTLGPIFRTVRSYATHVPTFWANWGYIIASDALDPAVLGPEAIDRRLAERALDGRPSLVAQGEFYDGQTHVGMFALPLSLRRLLEESPQVDAS
jgi:spermidine synthase